MREINERRLYVYSSFISSLFMCVLFFYWFSVPKRYFEKRLVDESNVLLRGEKENTVNLEGETSLLTSYEITKTENFTSFRGNSYNHIVKSDVKLIKSFSEEVPPKEIWSVSLGEGYSGASVFNSLVYIQDYDEIEKRVYTRAFSLFSGEPIWTHSYKISVKRNHGFSRTVVSASSNAVISIGPKCNVVALNPTNGDFLWGFDLVSEYGSAIPLWYAGQCPIVENSEVVLGVCGEDILMMGVDEKTGEILWQTPNSENIEMSHASIAVATIHGKRLYIYIGLGGLVGISAEEEDKGEIIFTYKDFSPRVIAPSPVILEDNKLLLTAGYGSGSVIVRIDKRGGEFYAETEEVISKEKFACEQHTPLFIDTILYTVIPADGGINKLQFVAMKDGNILFTSGKERTFGLGPFFAVNNKIFLLDDYGTLTMLEAGLSYKETGRAKVVDGVECWAPMAFSQGYLLLRSRSRLVCLDIREKR